MGHMNRPCAVCRKREKPDDMTSTVVTLHAYRAGDFADFVDPTALSAGLRAMSRIPNPRAEMHATCADALILVSPELMKILIDKEVAADRIPEDTAPKIMEKIEEEYKARIEAEAKALGLIPDDEE